MRFRLLSRMFLGMALIIFISNVAMSQEVGKLQKEMNQALEAEVNVQKKVEKWSEKKQALFQEILDLKTRVEWTKYQRKKYQVFIEQKKKEIEELKRRKREMRKLRMELEPYLSQVVNELTNLIQHDLPFLQEERKNRLLFLNQSLTDYDIKLSERLRRVLKALLVEAGYGDSAEVREKRLSIEGKLIQVRILRLGRIALFYLTLDGGKAGKWNPQTRQWEPVDEKYADNVKKAMEIATQKRAAELVDLPIGRPEKKE